MISVIICSMDKARLNDLSLNIQNSIGVEFEIIAFDNKQARLGISEVYNSGFKKSKYPVICFMHEDVLFETPDWGRKVLAHLSNPAIGLIGVAGGDTKGKVPSSWPSFIFESEISIVQHFNNPNAGPEKIIKTGYPDDPSLLKRVCCIDGVWMCTRREVFEKFQFDPLTCPSFHGYDIDYSLHIMPEYSVAVVFDILLEHYSPGSFGKDWLLNSIRVSDKWQKTLPRSVRNLTFQDYVRQHWTAMNIFIEKMQELNMGLFFIIRQFLKYSFNPYFHFRHFIHSSRKIILKTKE